MRPYTATLLLADVLAAAAASGFDGQAHQRVHHSRGQSVSGIGLYLYPCTA